MSRLGFILVFLLLFGCTPAEDIEPQRWIAEDPEDTFEWPSGNAEALSRSEVRKLTGHPWKVALGDDLRNALLAVSGDSFTRNIQIPSDGRMRLEYGLLCASDMAFPRLAPVRLEVVLERQGRDPETLWEARLDGNDQEDRKSVV